MRILISTMVLLLANCAAVHWENPGNVKANLERDKAECDYEAQKALAPKQYGASSIGVGEALDEVRLSKSCLGARGWRQVPNG